MRAGLPAGSRPDERSDVIEREDTHGGTRERADIESVEGAPELGQDRVVAGLLGSLGVGGHQAEDAERPRQVEGVWPGGRHIIVVGVVLGHVVPGPEWRGCKAQRQACLCPRIEARHLEALDRKGKLAGFLPQAQSRTPGAICEPVTGARSRGNALDQVEYLR